MILPLFPLHAVLFPGGRLPLRIFEQRYMDMAKACLRDETPFGLCLIATGEEVASSPASPRAAITKPHATGTLAHIVDWDMPQLGILHITALGTQRLRLLRHWAEPSGLLMGEAILLDDDDASPVPEKYACLVPLLRAVINALEQDAHGHSAMHAPATPHKFHDATWVSLRFAEVLPIPPSAKQTLLEVDDSLDRLEIIYRFLRSKNLLTDMG